MTETNPDKPTLMEQQDRDQILYKARHTTPLQRVQWLEETLELLGRGVATSTANGSSDTLKK